MIRYELIFDGGSVGNPGRAYGSFRLRKLGSEGASGRAGAPTRLEFGHGTNNQAEYRALMAGIDALRTQLSEDGQPLDQTAIDVLGDSKLVINQMAGDWKIKNPELLRLHDQTLDLLAGFAEVTFMHQPRAKSQRTLGH